MSLNHIEASNLSTMGDFRRAINNRIDEINRGFNAIVDDYSAWDSELLTDLFGTATVGAKSYSAEKSIALLPSKQVRRGRIYIGSAVLDVCPGFVRCLQGGIESIPTIYPFSGDIENNGITLQISTAQSWTSCIKIVFSSGYITQIKCQLNNSSTSVWNISDIYIAYDLYN